MEDRNHLKELTAARTREKELLARIVAFEMQNNQKGMTAKQDTKLKEDFQAASQELTAMDWFYKALSLWQGYQRKFSLPYIAINYLNESVRLNPGIADAYNNRGLAYMDLGQYNQAIEDFNQAILLEPNAGKNFYNRGSAYYKLLEYTKSIEDLTRAISLSPDVSDTYNNRGLAYVGLGQLNHAFDDYSQAINLKSNSAEPFCNRGRVHVLLGSRP